MRYLLAAILAGCSQPADDVTERTDVAVADVVAGDGRTYDLVPERSALFAIVRADADTRLSGRGQDFTVAATGWSGTVNWPKDDPAACRIHLEAPVAGLVVDPDGYRRRAGLTGTLDAGAAAELVEALRGPTGLDAAQWARVEFDATACEGADDHANVTGTLTMHRQSVKVTIPMTVTDDKKTFHARGKLMFNASEWAIPPLTTSGGAVYPAEGHELHLDLTGVRR